MNCKPGDLAVVVGAEGTGIALEIMRCAIGRICIVKRLIPGKSNHEFSCSEEFVWELEAPIVINFVPVPEKTFFLEAVADRLLRPIRDNPGNEAWFKPAIVHWAKPKKVIA